jgi:hypothetical protein
MAELPTAVRNTVNLHQGYFTSYRTARRIDHALAYIHHVRDSHIRVFHEHGTPLPTEYGECSSYKDWVRCVTASAVFWKLVWRAIRSGYGDQNAVLSVDSFVSLNNPTQPDIFYEYTVYRDGQPITRRLLVIGPLPSYQKINLYPGEHQERLPPVKMYEYDEVAFY